MPERSTEAQLKERERKALEMLSEGYGSAHTAAKLAAFYGVSLRQARRYVSAAALDLVPCFTPRELDEMAALALHRLEMIAGRAMEAGDTETAVKATRAGAQALAQFRRAITAPAVRFRLPDAREPPF